MAINTAAVLWLVLALAMFAVAFVGIAWARRRARREVRVIVPADLGQRVTAATAAFTSATPWEPASLPEAPETAAAVEASLIAGDAERALEFAEGAFAASAAAGRWLAWALVENAQPTAALAQLFGDDAFSTYLRARATHLAFEHAAGARDAMPPLVTTADLAVLTLASGRGAATWLQGAGETTLSSAQVQAAIAEHREVTGRCLARALDALEAVPGFADAGYLVARLAVKAGMIVEARALFAALAPRMTGRPHHDAFERDRKDLEDPAAAVAAAKQAPVASAKAKRSRSLKVL